MLRPAYTSIALVLSLFLLPAASQVAYTLETGTGRAGACYLPTAGYTLGGPSVRGSLPLDEYAALPTVSGLPAQAGGMAIDGKNGAIYSTNGYVVQVEKHPYYLAPAISYSVGLSVYAPTGSLNGLAVDPKNGVLYAVDDFHLMQFDKNTLLPIAPVIHLSWLNSGTKLSGLGYDPCTGDLWSCDMAGHIYRMSTQGMPIGPQPKATVSTANPLKGLAINATNGACSIPAPFCSFQVTGYHVLVTDGLGIRDAMNPLSWPIAIAGNNTAVGLAFCLDGQLMPASSACPLTGTAVSGTGGGGAGGATVGVGTAMPFVVSRTNAIQLNGAPSNAFASLWVDYCPVQNGGVPLPTGDTAYVWPLSPTAIMMPVGTNAFGQASFPVPPLMVPPGLQVTVQWYFQDPSNPTLYGCFSDALVLVAGQG